MAAKIPINVSASGLNSAFSGLQSDGLPTGETKAEAPVNKVPKMGRVVLRREKAHRGGKTVVVVYDFESRINAKMIEEVARKLRNGCSCGGTTRDRTIEVQGDQPDRVRAILEKEGFRVAGI